MPEKRSHWVAKSQFRCLHVVWATVVLFGLVETPRCSAQVVEGRLLEERTGRIVSGAAVAVVAPEDHRILGEAVTSGGRFRIAVREAGNYRLRVTMLGYAPVLTAPVELVTGRVTVVAVRLAPDAVPLEPLTIVATRVEPHFMPGLRRRQAEGWGVFLLREELNERTGARLEDILRTMPGLRIVYIGVSDGPSDSEVRYIPMVETRSANTNAMSGMTCGAALYVDGVRVFEGHVAAGGNPLQSVEKLTRAEEAYRYLTASDLEAIEVYRGAAELPFEYSGSTSACGVVAVWLRSGYDDPIERVWSSRSGMELSGGAMLQLSGGFTSGTAAGAYAKLRWQRLLGPASLAASVAATRTDFGADHFDGLAARMSPDVYRVDDPGARRVALLFVDVGPEFDVLETLCCSVVAGAGVHVARRSFSVPFQQQGRADFTSWGGGPNAVTTLRVRLWRNVTLQTFAQAQHTWFGGFARLEMPDEPGTGATLTSLRTGVALGVRH